MADPISIISLGATVLSTGLGIAGQVTTANANAATARYQAQVAENNQQIAQQNARYAVQAGQTNAQAQDFRTRAILGQEAAAQGASGIDLTTGTPADVRSGTQQIGRLNTLNTIQEAALRGYGYQTQATSFASEAGLDRARAAYAPVAGGIGAASTILGGASSFSSKWLAYRNIGLLGGGGQDLSGQGLGQGPGPGTGGLF